MVFQRDFQALSSRTKRKWNATLDTRLGLGEALFLWLGFVSLGAAMGLTMYGLNGWLSLIYLHQVFEQPGDVWAQLPGRFMVRGAGIGALGGALLGALLLFYAGIRSTLACPAPLIVALVPKMASVVWMGWVVMGVNTVILFWCAPDLRVFDYARIVRDHAPITSRVFQTCGYLWDLGSPFGSLLGTFFALAMGCPAFDRAWRKHQKRNAS